MPWSSRWPAGRCRRISADGASSSAPVRPSLLRIIFALIISQLLQIEFLKVVGGLLLLWIAVKLAKGETAEEHAVAASDKLWRAVWTIAIADAAMSLDNVIAIAAVSKGDPWLFGFGLALSIPLIMVGSTIIMKMIERFPVIVWAGAALLGWIAGEMIAHDPYVVEHIRHRAGQQTALCRRRDRRGLRGGRRVSAQSKVAPGRRIATSAAGAACAHAQFWA